VASAAAVRLAGKRTAARGRIAVVRLKTRFRIIGAVLTGQPSRANPPIT
jgi:hypothetical protein